MSEVAVKDLKLSVACKKDQVPSSSSSAAITTEDAAIGQPVWRWTLVRSTEHAMGRF
jgi:hypothetical protein